MQEAVMVDPAADAHRFLLAHGSYLLLGESLLVMGPSGCGKSSLLRVIAGLWTVGSGTVRGPAADRVFFLPQVSYGKQLPPHMPPPEMSGFGQGLGGWVDRRRCSCAVPNPAIHVLTAASSLHQVSLM